MNLIHGLDKALFNKYYENKDQLIIDIEVKQDSIKDLVERRDLALSHSKMFKQRNDDKGARVYANYAREYSDDIEKRTEELEEKKNELKNLKRKLFGIGLF